jgi:hypothetical protein
MILLLTLDVFKRKKMHFAHQTRLRPSTACRPRPVNEFGKALDGTGRHAVDGTRPTRKDGDGGQPYTYPCIPSASALHTPIYITIGADADLLYTHLTHFIGAPHLTGADYGQNDHRALRSRR